MRQMHTSRRRSAGGFLVVLFLLLPFGLLVLPTTLLLAAGLIPTMVAIIADRDPDKSAALSVGAMNFAGVMPFCIQLWQGGHTSDLTFRLLSAPTTWIIMYAAAGAGWIVYYIVPRLVAGYNVSRAEAKIAELQVGRNDLIADWGPEVAGRPEDVSGTPEEDQPEPDAPER